MNKIKKKLSYLSTLGIITDWQGGTGLPAPQGDHPIATVVKNIVLWLTSIFGFIGLIAFIVGGIIYLTAAGDTTRIELGKKTIWYAIIGIIIGLAGLVVITTIDFLLRGGGGA